MNGALKFNKKGFELITNWVAILFFAILILSFLFSMLIVNQWVTYTIVVFVGVILGHFVYTSKYGNRFPYYVLSFGFLLGILVGHRAGNGLIIIALFIGTVFLVNQIHLRTL